MIGRRAELPAERALRRLRVSRQRIAGEQVGGAADGATGLGHVVMVVRRAGAEPAARAASRAFRTGLPGRAGAASPRSNVPSRRSIVMQRQAAELGQEVPEPLMHRLACDDVAQRAGGEMIVG